MSNRKRLTIPLLLGAMLISGNALAEGVNVKGYVFGGGNLANVGGSVVVNIESGLIEKDVHGGGALANTNINNATNYGENNETISSTSTNKTTVNLTGGTVNGDIYGGGLGNADTAAWVYGDVTLTLNGTTMDTTQVSGGHIFGGNNINGAPKGKIVVDIIRTVPVAGQDKDVYIVYGGGNQAHYDSISQVNIHNCGNVIGNVYGGGNAAQVKGTEVNVYGGIIDSVYGGGYGASVTQYGTDVHIYGGTISAVFGGNNQSGTVTGDISVNINKQTEPDHDACEMHLTSVYGGGNLAGSQAGNITIINTGGTTEGIDSVFGGANNAPVTGDIELNITGGRIKNLYGGNNTGNVVNGNIVINIEWDGQSTSDYLYDVFGGGNHAEALKNTTVNLKKGVVSHNIYGGGSLANVAGSTTVTITGDSVKNDVYGGGMKGDVMGAVTVNIGKSDSTGIVFINHDVYGGGALAHTNKGNLKENDVIKTDSLVTTVNLYPGATINNDVYGGGLGNPDTAAIVYGKVTVHQFGAVLIPAYNNDSLATSGRIFGCNNVNGTPMGHVLVHVKKTIPGEGQHRYDLAAVYGGGNKAEYVPYNIGLEPATSDFAEVKIEPDNCDDISIHSVYGGGNAASTPATKVTVSGAYEIEYIFGGGNGAGANNPGANVGYHQYPDNIAGSSAEHIAERRNQSNGYIYGSGLATTDIFGGTIHYVYGGSNTRGNVRETAVSMLDEVSSCPLIIDGIYGGGREAYMEGATSLELGCITGMEELYGGSEKADVGGNIELTITSGHFGKVFGGNNKGGRIFGSITLNIEQTGCVPITIDTIYLGGNNAPYSVYGYKNDTIKVNVGTEQNPEYVYHYKLKESGDRYPDPKLNIRSFKSIGTVFGGGNGSLATMVGDPTVDINVTQGWVNGEYLGINSEYPEYNSYSGTPQEIADGTIGTVYGGGNRAEVRGSTSLLIGDKMGTSDTLRSMVDLYSTLPANSQDGELRSNIEVKRATVEGKPGVSYSPVADPSKAKSWANVQPIKGATITGNVYGGGNNADVTGGTTIKIGPDPE